MLTDFRKVVNRVTVPAGWQPGAITSKMFRHTYASSRLQTVDRGAPVALWTVEPELGHGHSGGGFGCPLTQPRTQRPQRLHEAWVLSYFVATTRPRSSDG
jgi:hypothetical protein